MYGHIYNTYMNVFISTLFKYIHSYVLTYVESIHTTYMHLYIGKVHS